MLNDKIYIGYTSNLKRRIKEHQKEKVWTTSRMGTVNLIFYEAFTAEKDARRRENYFKTSKGRNSLRQIIRDSLIT